jgi:NAD(P)-dependent dehydrogenase (short-subunit alcohol dehydrogenase family)
MKVDGVAAIVTGGGSGMGAEVARHLAAQGAKVALLDVNEQGAQATAKEIGGVAVRCDVANAADAEAAVAKAREAHGPARILMNCAGVATPGRIVGREGPLNLDAFRRVIEINLIGSFNMLRLAAADMSTMEPLEDNERGVIINTASVAAYEGQIGQAAYSASKGGIVGLTLPAARELARFGIRVVTVAPGLIATPMIGGMTEEVRQSLIATTVFPQRLGEPGEFARLALHIIDNVLINGETIRLDGAVRLAPR